MKVVRNEVVKLLLKGNFKRLRYATNLVNFIEKRKHKFTIDCLQNSKLIVGINSCRRAYFSCISYFDSKHSYVDYKSSR
jgi:hypothetical protein